MSAAIRGEWLIRWRRCRGGARSTRFGRGTVLLSAASLTAAQDVSTRVQLTSVCAKVELLLGRREQAQARLLEALDEVSGFDPEVGARLMVELASSAFHGADIDGIRVWASRALDIARACEDRGLTVGACAA